MKPNLSKISMVVVATMVFGAVLLLSVEKNEQGKWAFAPVSAYAQGDEDGESGGGEGDETANSIIITQTDGGFTCINDKVFKVVSIMVVCLGDGDLPCVAGDYEQYTPTEGRCGGA